MNYHIQPYSPMQLDALTAFIGAYRRVFPDAKLLSAEAYASLLELNHDQRLWCACNQDQRVVGFAPLFAAPVTPEQAPNEPNRIWTVVLADPTLPDAEPIRSALLQEVSRYARRMASTFPTQHTCLSADLMASQQPDIQHLLDNGFRVFAIVDVLECATTTSTVQPAPSADLNLMTTKLTTSTAQQSYLAAYNQCFPERPKTLMELQFFLASPVWSTGAAIVALDRQQRVIGSVLIYADSHQPRCAIIDDVFVLPEWRGQGIARQLLRVCLEYAAGHDIERVRLEVKRDNTPAQRLYRAVGFAPINEELLLEQVLS